jgi:hypothetical protein
MIRLPHPSAENFSFAKGFATSIIANVRQEQLCARALFFL